MKKFTKMFLISAFASVSLFANDNLVVDFEKKRVSQNPNIKVKNIKVFYKKELETKGWYGYILDLNATIQDKNMNVKDTLFSDGNVVATDLFDLKTGKSLKDSITPTLGANYYDKSKLIAGNEKAKDKLVVFSDPLCPFCMIYVPQVIEYVNQNSQNLALYYYAFPLTHIHPASTTLSKLIELAKEKNKDMVLKAYQIDWTKYFDASSTDDKQILEAFNSQMGTTIKLDDLKTVTKVLEKEISMGENALVSGTPTIYVNGEKDSTRELYKNIIKK